MIPSVKGIDKFARISPIAWAHIAFTGKYNFKKSNGEIAMHGMVSAIKKHLKKHFWWFLHTAPKIARLALRIYFPGVLGLVSIGSISFFTVLDADEKDGKEDK